MFEHPRAPPRGLLSFLPSLTSWEISKAEGLKPRLPVDNTQTFMSSPDPPCYPGHLLPSPSQTQCDQDRVLMLPLPQLAFLVSALPLMSTLFFQLFRTKTLEPTFTPLPPPTLSLSHTHTQSVSKSLLPSPSKQIQYLPASHCLHCYHQVQTHTTSRLDYCSPSTLVFSLT